MLFPVPAAISCAIVSCGRYIRPQRCEQPVSPQGRWKGLCWHRSPYATAPRPPAPHEGRAGAAPAAWEFLHRRRASAAGCLAERAASEQPRRRRQGLRSRENMLPGSHRHHARKCVLWSLPHCYGNQVQGLGLTAAAGATRAARLPSPAPRLVPHGAAHPQGGQRSPAARGLVLGAARTTGLRDKGGRGPKSRAGGRDTLSRPSRSRWETHRGDSVGRLSGTSGPQGGVASQDAAGEGMAQGLFWDA